VTPIRSLRLCENITNKTLNKDGSNYQIELRSTRRTREYSIRKIWNILLILIIITDIKTSEERIQCIIIDHVYIT